MDESLKRLEDDKPHRDSWMEAPSALDVDYVQQKRQKTPPSQWTKAKDPDMNARNPQLEPETNDTVEQKLQSDPVKHEVNYTFGDSGSKWRMTKLKATYRQARESGHNIEEVAIERFGDLRSFDDAREEEIELDRRDRYGKGYVGKDKPNGDLFQERKLDHGIRQEPSSADDASDDEFETEPGQGQVMREKSPPATTAILDQTTLNKLKAQMTKAKLKGAPDAAKLESEYHAAAKAANSRQPDVVVLNKMESRLTAGGRKGEVKQVDNKRGRERGLVEENEDMSIEDMVRQERRTKGQYGGDAKAYAERIAKDQKYDNDLDYMDDNAQRLAKSVQKSEINLRSTAIGDYQKMKRILDTCPLCSHEDTGKPPQAPLVSLATRTYMTLPTSPEITPYGLGATIVPIQHRLNLLECDDDEWEEIRNFMKSLTRFYWAQQPRYSVLFYENAAHDGRKRHASLEAVPLPLELADTAPAFFKEAILAADEEWTQHKKAIDTLHNAEARGMGKLAFRRSMVAELPYFHVWFSLDGGLGHVVEDARRWPKGDLFAREILGGMLDVGPDVVKRQGRWRAGDAEMDRRVREFRRRGWEETFDWTKALMGVP